MKSAPVSILTITDSSGQVLYTSNGLPEQVVKEESAYLTTNLLRGVIENGTGWKARDLGKPAAGKTGTTNDYRDAWFIGYTPSLVAGVWVGYDNQKSIGPKETGAGTALPIWLDFMKNSLTDAEKEDFAVPEGIIFKNIDQRTGLLSTEHCKQVFREAFLPGTEPRKYCEEKPVDVPESLQIVHDEIPQSPEHY
jgi:penicillin-binding protein 1A